MAGKDTDWGAPNLNKANEDETKEILNIYY